MATSIDPETGLPFPDAGLIKPLTPPPTQQAPIESDPNYIDMEFTEEDGALLAAIDATPDIEMSGNEMDNLSVTTESPNLTTGIPGEPPGEAPLELAQVTTKQATRGITERGKKQAGGIFGQYQREADGRNAKLEDTFKLQKAQLDINFGKKKRAIEMQSVADQQHMAELADIHKQQLEFSEAQHKLEAMANEQAKAVGAQYIAAYKQEMVGVKQMMMQTGNPLGGLDTSGQLALGAALFTQGFLGARYGIQVNVAGQVENWVQREMNHHQQSIQNRTDMANSQMTLYGIARQNAADEWEARTRLRGFVIDGIKSRLLMEGDRWGVASAKAEAAAKAADLDMLQTTNDIALQDKVTKAELDNNKLAIDAAAAKAKASIEWQANELGKKRLALDEKREERLGKPTPGDTPWSSTISDPFDKKTNFMGGATSGGKRKWRIDPNAPAGVVTQATAQAGEIGRFYATQGENLDTLKELFMLAKPGMKGPEWFRNKASPEYRRYEAAKGWLTENVQKDITGAAAPDAQAARISGWLKADNFIELGNNAGLIDDLKDKFRLKHEKTMTHTPGIIPIKPGELPPEEEYDPMITTDPRGKTLAAISRGSIGDEPVPPGAAARLYDRATNVDSTLPAEPSMRLMGGGWGLSTEKVAIHELAQRVLFPEHFGAKADSWGVAPGKEDIDEVATEAQIALDMIAARKNGDDEFSSAEIARRVIEKLKQPDAKDVFALDKKLDALEVFSNPEGFWSQ